MTKEIKWAAHVEDHDYAAAEEYLCLIFSPAMAKTLAQKLRDEHRIVSFKAKDIFRASGLSLLGVSNSHVQKDLDKIKAGEHLSPILLMRDLQHGKVVIADGYHRMCSAYAVSENAEIPCKII
jgi:hypothetical protein